MSGVSTNFGGSYARRLPNLMLGSLGDDPPPDNTLSNPTVTDPTLQWQANVLAQLQAGVNTMKTAELQKWLQIAATVAIPVVGFAWKALFPSWFRKGSPPTVTE